MNARAVWLLPVLALAACAYAGTANNYHLYLITTAALTIVVGVGLNVLLGLTGQVSFGHVGFYALGAYAVAALTTKAGVPFWLAWPAAVALAAVVGAGVGLAALRVSGPYLAMVTIAFGFIVEYLAIEWKGVTGGANGLMNIPHPAVPGYEFGDRALAFLAIALAVACIAAYRRFHGSGWGLAMRATRDAETAAGSLGYRVVIVRTVAFTISAALAGAAGGLFAPLTTFVSPSSFSFFQSILFVLVVMIGGAERTYGPVIGAIVVIALPELLSGLAEYRVLFFGVLMLVVLWVAPGGIAGLLARRFGRRAAMSAGASAAPFALAPRAAQPLAVTDLAIAFGGVRAVDGVEFRAEPGRVTSIIGPNGAGKTTVLNLIGGFYAPDRGSVRLGTAELAGAPPYAVARAGIARTYQTSQLFGQMSVLENMLAAMRRGGFGSSLREALADAPAVARARALLDFVGFHGDAGASAGALPHVDRRLVEIARALAAEPAVLMLDEPAAGLDGGDTQTLGALLRRIADAGFTVVLIEHDMPLVMGISNHVVVLDAGRCIAQGAPDAVRADPAVIKAYLGAEGGKTVQPRPSGREPLRDDVLAVASLNAGYGAIGVLDGVSLAVNTGEFVALLGANGAGKSTLMKSLAGLLRPVRGQILLAGREVGTEPAHRLARLGLVLAPEGRQVFPELSVEDNIRLGAFARSDFQPKEVEALLARFPVLARRRKNRAGLLSGGEQQMLALARALVARPKVLLLDEPSLGLAPALVQELFDVLAQLRDEGVTILLVDQMAANALAVADRGYVLASGRIVHAGTAAELRTDPALERAYLGAV
jgi:ABC-type branched-subunit amino acid transport system ATPase component/ABC-type branched-subunit amino acid transport system permease subunit